jgi:hypothetical protein
MKMSKFEKPCFLLIDQKKNVCCISLDDRVLRQIVQENYPILRHKTMKELDQTIHEYVKTNFREQLHEEDMTDEY